MDIEQGYSPPITGERPADHGLLDLYDQALAIIDSGDLMRARIFIDAKIGKKHMRQILYDQIYFVNKIHQRIADCKFEKAVAWCKHLISKQLKMHFREEIKELLAMRNQNMNYSYESDWQLHEVVSLRS